jgi:transposase
MAQAGAVWTTERVAVLIHQQFGVSYHPAHVSRLLKGVKYRVQQPIERATQRDEKAITTWKDERWPA